MRDAVDAVLGKGGTGGTPVADGVVPLMLTEDSGRIVALVPGLLAATRVRALELAVVSVAPSLDVVPDIGGRDGSGGASVITDSML